MSTQTSIHFYKGTRGASLPNIKKIYNPEAGVWIVKTEDSDGNTQVLRLDLRNRAGIRARNPAGKNSTINRGWVSPTGKIFVGDFASPIYKGLEIRRQEYFRKTDTYPFYAFVAPDESEVVETDAPTDVAWLPARLSGQVVRTRVADDLRERLSFLANYFDGLDGSIKWGIEGSHDNNIIVRIQPLDKEPPFVDNEIYKVDNTSKHWPKGIGLANRLITRYEYPVEVIRSAASYTTTIDAGLTQPSVPSRFVFFFDSDASGTGTVRVVGTDTSDSNQTDDITVANTMNHLVTRRLFKTITRVRVTGVTGGTLRVQTQGENQEGYDVPVSFVKPNSGGSVIVLNMATGDGISDFIESLYEEYRYQIWRGGERVNPVRDWYVRAGRNLNTFNSYYNDHEWRFTNQVESDGSLRSQYVGLEVIYTGRNNADWYDLWTQYAEVRNLM